MFAYYRGNETFVKRILDLMDQSDRQNRWIITPFLTDLEQEIAQKVIGKQMYIKLDGGYENAQMKRLGIGPFMDDVAMEITCLKAVYKLQEKELCHRDVLGALMNLGLSRNQFGDIRVIDTALYIFVRSEVVPLLQLELTQIGRYVVRFEECFEEIQYEEKRIYMTKTISSLRLDCVVAACANVSRKRAEELIQAKLVKVDHLPLEDCTSLCNNNSTVSIRGYGRFQLLLDGRVSKKGRILVEIAKYAG